MDHPADPSTEDSASGAASAPGEEEILERTVVRFRRLRPGEFSRRESRAVWTLCGIYSLGILGLYLLLPILSPYAHTLKGQTDLLVGLSIGAYGLTQTIFQIPFGHLSDRIGRKRTIFLGLTLFAVGGLIAASARQIEVLILGRLLQGAGAVASAVVSLLADLTRPSVRTQAMARLGLAIGGAFALGMIVGPVAAHLIGIRTLLLTTALISLGAGIYLLAAVPEPRFLHREEQWHATDLLGILRQRRLFLLDGGTFLLHNVVTILFVIVPFDLAQRQSLHELWKVALPVLVVGLGTMFLTSRWGDSTTRSGINLYIGFALLALSCVLLGLARGALSATVIAMLVFVLSVAFLEPALPSTMSRFAVGRHRGTAMGVFHMSQFLGSFTGGLLGGVVLHRDRVGLFFGLAALAGILLLIMYKTGNWRPGIPPGADQVKE